MKELRLIEGQIISICERCYPAESYLHGLPAEECAGRIFIASEESVRSALSKCEELLVSLRGLRGLSGSRVESRITDDESFLLSLMEEIMVDYSEPHSALESIIYAVWIYILMSRLHGAQQLTGRLLSLLRDSILLITNSINRFAHSSFPVALAYLLNEDVAYLRRLTLSATERFGPEREGIETTAQELLELTGEYLTEIHGVEGCVCRPEFDKELQLRYGYDSKVEDLFAEGRTDADRLLHRTTSIANGILGENSQQGRTSAPIRYRRRSRWSAEWITTTRTPPFQGLMP